jgi:hypothetical protein
VHGGIQVRIVQTVIGTVRSHDNFGNFYTSDREWLVIQVELRNMSSTLKVDYSTWRAKSFSLDRDYATLADDLGNGYKRIALSAGTYPNGSVERTEAIYPNKTETDILLFETPVAAASYLDLELPAANYGASGMIRFRIVTAFGEAQQRKMDAAKARAAELEARRKAEIEAAKERAERVAAEAKRQAELEKADRAAAPLLVEAKKLYEKEATRDKGKKALEEITREYRGTKTAKEAQTLLAAPLLEEAKKLISRKDTADKGRVRLREIIKVYPDATMTEEARKLLEVEEAKQTVDVEADRHLTYAKKLIAQGMREKAKERLKEIVRTFPLSKTTEEARELLEEIEYDEKLSKKPDK